MRQTTRRRVRLGIARDEAFHFYYPDNLESLAAAGAEWAEFSPLADRRLPEDLDGLYFGGGYPEVHAARLAANRSMLDDVRRFASSGRAVYAECGGLMYLGRSLRTLDGARQTMAGVLPLETAMLPRLKTLGYAEVSLAGDSLWGAAGDGCRGHEFHYSEIVADDALAEGWRPAYSLRRRRAASPVAEGFAKGRAAGQLRPPALGLAADNRPIAFWPAAKEPYERRPLPAGLLIVSHGSPRPKPTAASWRWSSGSPRGWAWSASCRRSFRSRGRTFPTAWPSWPRCGVRRIVLMPYFLYSGQHVTHDIPALLDECRRQFPGVALEVLPTLENDPAIEDLVLERLTAAMDVRRRDADAGRGDRAAELRNHRPAACRLADGNDAGGANGSGSSRGSSTPRPISPSPDRCGFIPRPWIAGGRRWRRERRSFAT